MSRRTTSEHQFEQFIGNLLRGGVILTTTLVLVGGVLYLIRHGAEAPNYQLFRGEPAEFRTVTGVAKATLAGRRRGLIQLGVLLLIATPVIRVAVSLLAFVKQQDLTYIIVTSIVLGGLLYSLIGSHS